MADNAAQWIKTEVAERRRRASGRAGGRMRKGRSGESGRRRAAVKSKRQGQHNAQRAGIAKADGEGRLNGKKANEEAAGRRKRESEAIHIKHNIKKLFGDFTVCSHDFHLI